MSGKPLFCHQRGWPHQHAAAAHPQPLAGHEPGRISYSIQQPTNLIFGRADEPERDPAQPARAKRFIGEVRAVADYAIECVGTKRMMEQELTSVHRGGTVVLVGIPPVGTELAGDPFPLIQERVRTSAGFGGARQRVDLPTYVDLFMAGTYKLRELVSQEIAMDDLNPAYDQVEAAEVRGSMIGYS